MSSSTAARALLETLLFKWIPIRDGKKDEFGPHDCILCQIYRHHEDKCYGCPIYEKTKQHSCRETPFIEWRYHLNHYHRYETSLRVRCRDCRELAQQEVMFLYDLFLIESQRSHRK